MANIIKESFSVNLLIMKILGLYPLENHSYISAVLAYVPYLMFAVLIPVLNILYFLLAEEFDMVAFYYNASYICEATCFVLKLFSLIRRRHRIKNCINYFGDPYFSSCRPNQKKIIENCVGICKRNSKIFIFGVTACVISWIASPIFNKGNAYTLPLEIWLPFDVKANLTFYMVYFYITLGKDLLYISYAATAADPIIGGLTCHAAFQLKILKDNLKHLDKYTEEQIDGNTQDSYFSRNLYFDLLKCKIKDCIKHHNAILRFILEFEKCFSIVVFSQFAAGLFSISFCIIQFGMMAERTYFDFNFFVTMTSICTVIAQIYFYCYYGTMLFEENNSLTDAIYMGKWYKYDAKSKKSLIILMERSRKPIIITAGKLLELSLNTFTAILKKAYSLCAVLQNFQ